MNFPAPSYPLLTSPSPSTPLHQDEGSRAPDVTYSVAVSNSMFKDTGLVLVVVLALVVVLVVVLVVLVSIVLVLLVVLLVVVVLVVMLILILMVIVMILTENCQASEHEGDALPELSPDRDG